jgi:hypothetical protein
MNWATLEELVEGFGSQLSLCRFCGLTYRIRTFVFSRLYCKSLRLFPYV